MVLLLHPYSRILTLRNHLHSTQQPAPGLQLFSTLHKRSLSGTSSSRVCTYMLHIFSIENCITMTSRDGRSYFSRSNNNFAFCTQETTKLCTVLENGRGKTARNAASAERKSWSVHWIKSFMFVRISLTICCETNVRRFTIMKIRVNLFTLFNSDS
jgi:hypothetical protein